MSERRSAEAGAPRRSAPRDPSHVDSARMLIVPPMTSAAPPSPVRRAPRLVWRLGLLPLLAVLVGLGVSLATPSPARATVSKGLIDVFLEAEPAESTARAGMIREIDRGLGAHWVRVGRRLEPPRADARRLRARRARAPRRPRRRPARRRRQGHPHDLLPARLGDRPRTGGRIRRPATPRGRRPSTRSVTAPSGTTATSPSSSRAATRARRRRSSAGTSPTCGRTSIPSAPPATRTSPPACTCACSRRSTPAWRAPTRACASSPAPPPPSAWTTPTAPARSASPASCAARGAGRFFDVYSHHPYTPGGSIYTAPDQPPNDPSHTVTLFNLRTLLRLFPGKPFYLTEYGYNTQPNQVFGVFVERAGPGSLPDDGLPLRGALPAGEAARVVPGPRREAGLGARRISACTRA